MVQATPFVTAPFAKDVIATELSCEIRDSFVAYAMSVITARALPDARDGLKPVQRRILYAMDRMGARPGTPTRKSARVTGEVMGRYHPHGDSAIYDALVRLGQDFARNVPLVDAQGNFGSLDDPPAAQRYTECRLSAAAGAMLADLDEDAVDLRPTYDGEGREPVVLPAALPNLLVNGSGGIAVGMATSIAPHNLVEVAAAIDLVLRRKRRVTIDELLAVLPGPDFPSGGVVIAEDLAAVYRDGRGQLKVRAQAAVVAGRGGRQLIEVTELPYQVGPERVIGRVKELLAAEKLPQITGIVNLSDRHHGLRLQIELKAGADAHAVLAELYRTTPLEESFSVNHVVLVNGHPRTVGLIELCEIWIGHRIEVIRRRSTWRRARAADRLHLVAGLLVALDVIDTVVATIRAARDTATARAALMQLLALDQIQVDHLLEMPLRRLTALERTRLEAERDSLAATMTDLDALLASETRQRNTVSRELAAVVAAHGRPRRSRLSSPAEVAQATVNAADGTTRPSPVGIAGGVLRLSAGGTLTVDGSQPRRGGGVDSVAIGHLEAVSGVALAVTDQGRALVVDPHDATVEGLEPGERLVAVVDAGVDLVLATARGLVKRLVADTMGSLRRDRRLIRLDDGDEVVGAWPAEGDLILVTDDAQVLRTGTGDIPARGGAAGGVAGIRVGDGRRVIGGGVGSDGDVVAVLDDTGRVKSTALAELPTTGRGGKGVRLAKLRDGALAAALVADPSTLAVAYARRSGPWPGTSTKRATGMVDGDAAVLAIGLTAVAS